MNPNRLRSERQKQYNYMSQQEYENELKQQIEDKKIQRFAEQIQNQQEILSHYKNYQLGADQDAGESQTYMNDLNQLLKNKEQEIERYQGMLDNMGGMPKSEVFQGDMNAIGKNLQQLPQPSSEQGIRGGPTDPFEKKGMNLFDDQFLKNYNKESIPQPRNNENHNINNIYGNQAQPSVNIGGGYSQGGQMLSGDSERERRLKLRELERQKRQEGLQGDGYGQVETASKPITQNQDTKQNIFGEQQPASKREQIWQQKLQQKRGGESVDKVQSSNQVQLPINVIQQFQPQQQQQLPVYNIQQNTPILPSQERMITPEQNMRNSRIGLTLSEARKLDQSLNQDEILQQLPPKGAQGGIIPHGDDLMQKRRENEKRQRQQEYQDFLAKQKQGKGQDSLIQNPTIPSQLLPSQVSIPQHQSRPQSHNVLGQANPGQMKPIHQHSSDQSVLQAVGMQQLGLHQQKQAEDKHQKQREYREFLDKQNQQQSNQQKVGERDRRKEISDQVFQEVLSSHGKFTPSQYMPPSIQPIQETFLPLRGVSASTPQRKDLNSQQSERQDQFFKNQASEEERRKMEHDKKKEYAMQLQQQMASKQSQSSQGNRRRGTSQQNPHQLPPNQEQMSYQQPQIPQQNVFEYQMQNQGGYPGIGVPSPYQMPVQDQYSQNFNLPLQYPGSQNYQPSMMQQPPPLSYFDNNQIGFAPSRPPLSIQQPMGMPMSNISSSNVTPTYQQQQQPSYGNLGVPDAGAISQKQKQEEYRRELEYQIKVKEDQKKQKELDNQQFDQRIDREIQNMQQPPQKQMGMIQQQQIDYGNPGMGGVAPQINQNQNFTRQRTDVSRVNDPEGDQNKAIKQQLYQEELKKQMEEQKRLKDDEKRKLKMEDEEHERKMKLERDQLGQKEHQELVKEGKRDPNAPYVEKKRSVRRDQFEPSQDNPNIKQAPIQKEIQRKEEEWQRPQQQQDIYENKRPDLFGGAREETNHYSGMQQNFQGFGGPSQGLDLPINKPREDIFGPGVQNNFNDNFQPREALFGGNPLPSQGFVPRQNALDYQMQQPQFQQPMTTVQPSQDNQQKMMEEQQKMIVMYQQALEQILQFRNQYFEQAMQMRENIVKEREQLLEYEKMKSQQNQEINQLQAVYNQLGSLLTNVNDKSQVLNSGRSYGGQQQNQQPVYTPILNPQVQNNLNNLIISQKQQIIRMSQSGGLPLQNHQRQQVQEQQKYPQNYIINASPAQEETNILEQSLSCDTKLVHIPQNKLQSNELFSTWKQVQLLGIQQQQQQVNQSQNQLANSMMQKSLAGSSQFVGQFQTTTPAKQLTVPKTWQSRPQTSQPPETIQELPNQEDDQINQSKSMLTMKNKRSDEGEEQDFDRDDSNGGKGSPHGQTLLKQESINRQNNNIESSMQSHLITGANPLGNTTTIQDNILQIERMIQQNSIVPQYNQNTPQQQQMQQIVSPINKQVTQTIANHTSSSFYNQTLHQQRIQEQTQQEELQKQLMRIFGNTGKSDNIVSQMNQQPSQFQNNQPSGIKTQQIKNPLKIAAQNERMSALQMSSDERDMLMQSQINIAESANGTQTLNNAVREANMKFSSNAFHSKVTEENPDNILDDTKNQDQDDEDEEFFGSQQVQQIQMSQPQVQDSRKLQFNRIEESSQGQDIWNDPDMIPPPVVMDDDDEGQNFQIETQSNNHYNGNYYGQNYGESGENDMLQEDRTLKNLKMFSPPSDDNNYNLAQYNQEITESDDNRDYSKPLPDQFRQTQTNNLNYNDDQNQNQQTATKKEQELLEIQQLIQRATDKTKNVLEQSDHFKFKIGREKEQKEQPSYQKKNTNTSSRKNIKIGDPFKNVDSKQQQNSKITDNNSVEEGDSVRDKTILDNIDKMIFDLQAQQQRVSAVSNKIQYQPNEPEQYQNEQDDQNDQEEEIKEQEKQVLFRPQSNYSQQPPRPISAVSQQPKVGKYTQMALNQQSQQEQSKKSNKSLGKFAQMALQNTDQNQQDQILDEVSQKYGSINAQNISQLQQQQQQQFQYQSQQQQQQILRPVSGKSNSTRYQVASSQSGRRNIVIGGGGQGLNQQQQQQQQQQPFYDESENDIRNSVTSGFNLALIDDDDNQ